MTFQPLANATLVIRPFEAGDADEFVRAAHESIETVGKWMSWCTPSFNREQALAWFASCDQDRAAGRAFDGPLFGHLDLFLDTHRSTEGVSSRPSPMMIWSLETSDAKH